MDTKEGYSSPFQAIRRITNAHQFYLGGEMSYLIELEDELGKEGSLLALKRKMTLTELLIFLLKQWIDKEKDRLKGYE